MGSSSTDSEQDGSSITQNGDGSFTAFLTYNSIGAGSSAQATVDSSSGFFGLLLQGASLLPGPVGAVANGANAISSLSRGDTAGAVISGAAAIGAGFGIAGAGAIAKAAETAEIANELRIAADSGSTLAQLRNAASQAAAVVGEGRGAAYGTKFHTAFESAVKALDNPELLTEQSYLNRQPVRRGFPGSVRLDVVQGSRESITAVYDLKTGTASLTAQRIREIQSHLPAGSESAPVIEIRRP